MYLFYVDESGNTGMNLESEEQPIHWLCAVGVASQEVNDLERSIRDVARRYCGLDAEDAGFELHGSEIFAGSGAFRDQSPEDRVSLYSDLLNLLEDHECPVFIRGIDKGRHQARASARNYPPYHPHRVAFMFLMEDIDRWLENSQPEAEEWRPRHGLIVADEHGQNRELIVRFPGWRESGTWGYRAREIAYLIDTIHTVPSHDSWLIQLVDCVVYIRNRYRRVVNDLGWDPPAEERSARAVVDLWRECCWEQVNINRTWP